MKVSTTENLKLKTSASNLSHKGQSSLLVADWNVTLFPISFHCFLLRFSCHPPGQIGHNAGTILISTIEHAMQQKNSATVIVKYSRLQPFVQNNTLPVVASRDTMP
ncbi:hypothetical protein RRG08_027492 [Elysia crispata]|uniref:Uncharacterized protein n=1 Tax=Elysia crispata TaxID=231223 RepID=A0AAE0YSD9_9GAST|nr:hypothetical protein RRG08_027492 [Elysia crispata]